MTRTRRRRARTAWPCDPLRQGWRNRFADTLRRFRRIKGRWPEPWMIRAAYRGMEQAINQRIPAPTDH